MDVVPLLLMLAAAVVVLALAALQRSARRAEQLATQVAQLAEQIGERDAQLQRAAQQRRELLANVSHDLRTPLAAMQGYLELLLLRHGSLEPAEERNYLQTAARHSERLGRLVGALFDLTRLEANELVLLPEDFAPAELAQDVVQKFAYDARQRGVQLVAAGDGTVCVHADLGLVARVFEGLLENALRHTPVGGCVELEIRAAGPRAALVVRDNGEGIAAADLPGLFDRYDRAARVQGGGPGAQPGLGLAIAQRIVRLHGGELAVRSAPGRGTEVTFDLPRVERAHGSQGPASRPAGLAA